MRGDEAEYVRGERLLDAAPAPGVGNEPEPAELLGTEEPGEQLRVLDARRREDPQAARERGGDAAARARLPDRAAELPCRAVEFGEIDRFQTLQFAGPRGHGHGPLDGQAVPQVFVQQQTHQQIGELLTVQLPFGRRLHGISWRCHAATSARSRS